MFLLSFLLTLSVPVAQKRPAKRKPPQVSPGTGKDWPTYGGTLDNWRYSTLSQINKSNVGLLQPAWTLQPSSAQTSFECTPLVVDGIMYLTTGDNQVYAIKADTGEVIWVYAPRITYVGTKLCCGFINRGVAVQEGRVFITTIDARLIALDRESGKPIASFGKNGEVQIADHSQGYSETAAPVVAGGKVLIGVAGGEFRIRGFFSAYDSTTGKLVWRFNTIPEPGEPGGETWPKPDAYKEGGGPVWTTPAVDESNGLVIFGTGNPNPDFNGNSRLGDNLYTCSVVALDINTGQLRWYFQEVKHDLWDYDQAAPPILFDVKFKGRMVQAVGAAGKVGWFYMLDRKTGKSLVPLREVAVPQDAAQGTARTQLVPAVPPFVDQENIFTPPTASGVQIAPGYHGGSKWFPLAYSPLTRLVYVTAVNKQMIYKIGPEKPEEAHLILGGTATAIRGAKTPSGFVAIDVNTGFVRWRAAVTSEPGGGLMATAGGLVFSADGVGNFLALDSGTGERLWQYLCVPGQTPERTLTTPPAINAAPMTYEVNGRQYVAVATDNIPGKLFVFSLPLTDKK